MQLLTRFSLCFIALVVTINISHAQTYKWMKGGGSTDDLSTALYDEQIDQMCTDANGNLYVLGVMGNGAMTADTFSRTGAYGAHNNVFIASYNCGGQMRWAKLIGSANDNFEYGIAADNLGHIYVAGRFLHIGGPHTLYAYDTTITAFPYLGTALLQYDTSGEFNWISFMGDNVFAAGYSIGDQKNALLIDGANQVHFVCGAKPGSHFTPSIPTHYGIYDVVFDGAGTMLSAAKLQQDTTLTIGGAALDKITNKLYVYGSRHSDFMGGSSPLTYHPYVAAFDASRNLIWSDTLCNPVAAGNAAFSGILTDEAGHLYALAGGFNTVSYQHDTLRNFTTGGYIALVMKLDTNSQVRWIRNYGSNSSYNALLSLTMMPGNKIAAAGFMFGMVVSGTDTLYNYTGEGANVDFTILDTAGYIHSLQQLHGSGFNDEADAIAADSKGSLYIGGKLESNVWAGSLSPYTSVGGNTDFFVIKYGVECNCTYMPTANYTVAGGATKTFTYTGSVTAIDSVRWEFGDGGTSTVLSPTHSYITGDTFAACVTVYTACGSDTHCSDFIIPCVGAPTASYTASGTGLSRSFTYTGTGLGTGSVSWNFGDGTAIAAGTPVTHTFSAAGTYNVCLTATNTCGSNISCTLITVTCATLPTSAFTFSGTGASRSFTYTGTTAGLDSVTWTFGDGGIATGLTPSHTYATIGPKTVCATVHTNCGTATHCNTVTILCITAPVAAFTATGTGAVASFTYTGTTVAIDSFHWDFGDGGNASGTTPSHTYAATGTFHVCVTAYSACGNHTICHDVAINCITPVTAAFTDTGNVVRGFVYTGTTTGLDSVVWDYGDSHRDTGVTAHHTYAHSGTYHVCVKVYADCGANTLCHDLVVTHTTSIAALSLADIKVYPNPATNELSITGIPGTTTYRLLTVTGINLQAGLLQTGNSTIALPNISAGMYLLEMTGPTGEKNTMRFIKG